MNEDQTPQQLDPVITERAPSALERSAQVAQRMVTQDKLHRNHRLLSDAFSLGNKYSPSRNKGVRSADPYAAASNGRSHLRFLETRARSAGVPVPEIRAAYAAGGKADKLQGSTELKQAAFDYAEARFSSYQDALDTYNSERYARRILDHKLPSKPSALTPAEEPAVKEVKQLPEVPVTWDGISFTSGGSVLTDGRELSPAAVPGEAFMPHRKEVLTTSVPKGSKPIKGLFSGLEDDQDSSPVDIAWGVPEIGLARASTGHNKDQFYVRVSATTTRGGRTRRVFFVRPLDAKHVVPMEDGRYLYNHAGTQTAADAIRRHASLSK